MKIINTKDAVGMVLCHDITKIVPGEFKGAAFKKGHIVREEDILELLKLGKDHLYLWEKKEGKIDFFAEYDGLVSIDVSELLKANSIGEIIASTIHNNTPVKAGEKIAGTRIIPLVIEEEKIKKLEEVCKKNIISVKKINSKKTAVITTGSEVFYGRIEDKFGPVIKSKVGEYNCEVISHVFCPDDKEIIKENIKKALESEAELVICTGGMSVDPDDMTPASIKESGGEIVTYGSPVLPGAMLLVAYKDGKTILGLPGCVMYARRTVFDLVLPRVLADEKLTFEDIAAYGHGGLCLDCEICHFPHCSFGKGV